MRIAAKLKTAALLFLVGGAAALIFAAAGGAAFWGCAGSSSATGEEKGWVPRDILETPPYAAFKAGYDTASVDMQMLGLIRRVDQGVDVTVFFGAWCGDSKREVPRFLKLADSAGIPSSRIRFYALDRTKKSDDGLTDKFAIERIPTFIFLKDGKEIGRITESPSTTMAGDVLSILARAPRE